MSATYSMIFNDFLRGSRAAILALWKDVSMFLSQGLLGSNKDLLLGHRNGGELVMPLICSDRYRDGRDNE